MADVRWIKIVTDIFDDEKIILIETMPDCYAIIVVWFKLLCLAGKQNNGGVFIFADRIPYTDKMLSKIFRMNEATVTMALKVFQDFGMIEIIDNTITIPNWNKHQTLDTYERQKEKDRLRKQRLRAEQRALIAAKSPMSTDASEDMSTDTSAEESGDVHPLDIDKDIDKEKKEIKNRDTVGAEPSDEASDPPAEPPLFSLPLNDGSMHGITQAEVDGYSELYPAVDVPQEIRKMIGWLNANPAKRKTRRGIRNFINSWLSREQDKGGKNRPVYGGKSTTPQPPKQYASPEDFY